MKARPTSQHIPLTRTGQPESSQQTIEALQVELLELKQDLVECERALAAARNEISTITTRGLQHAITVEAWGWDIAELKAEIQGWKSALTTIEQSKSWKLTRPARSAANALRNARITVERTLGALRGKRADAKEGIDRSPRGSALSPERPIPIPPEILEKFARAQMLEEATRNLLKGARDSTGDGIYVHHVPHNVNPHLLNVKAVAFYKPQSSEPSERRGSYGPTTDWAAISKAVPRYLGHYQPHIPDDLGYYDLQMSDVFEKQIGLATQYGIYGFCFQCRRLSTRSALDLPLRQLLSEPDLEISFCLALEAGSIRQSTADDESRFETNLQLLADIFADRRYIRVGNKPLLVLLKPEDLGDVRSWRKELSAITPEPVYMAGMCSSNASEALRSEFDAVIENPLDDAAQASDSIRLIDPAFKGEIYSYPALMERYTRPEKGSQVPFKNVITGWDTEPNNPGEGRSLAEASPTLYARWFERSCRLTLLRNPDERFVFISSWNNWSEGSHLEPDHRFGYAYLHATANVLRRHHRDDTTESLINEINAGFSPSSDVAVVFHCFHEDLITPIFDDYISKLKGVDLFVTVRKDISRSAIEMMRERFDHVFFEAHENRGRDIRPFLFVLERIQSLGYRYGCKIHTKKTPHAENGEGGIWRQQLMRTLLGADDSKSRALRLFEQHPDLGLLVPSGSLQDLSELRHHVDNALWLDRLLGRLERMDLAGAYRFHFPAGSMYWFRVDALRGFENLALVDDDFELEMGQRDGTLAHAMERLVSLYALQNGYRTEEIDLTENTASLP